MSVVLSLSSHKGLLARGKLKYGLPEARTCSWICTHQLGAGKEHFTSNVIEMLKRSLKDEDNMSPHDNPTALKVQRFPLR